MKYLPIKILLLWLFLSLVVSSVIQFNLTEKKIDLSLVTGVEAILDGSKLSGVEVSASGPPVDHSNGLDQLKLVLGLFGKTVGVATGVLTLYFLCKKLCFNNNNGANANTTVHPHLEPRTNIETNMETNMKMNIEMTQTGEQADIENQLNPM